MVLRKPYAFLIKYFRIIHLIIGLLASFLAYKLSRVMIFLNNYMVSDSVVIEKGIVGGLFSPLLYICVVLIIIATISILVLMAVKKKPILQYIYTIVVHVAIIAMIVFSYSSIKQLEISAVDVRVLKLCSDFLLITVILEITCLIAYFVRATGFNIKKFNFGEDLEELEITEKDNEEFEVSYELDVNAIRRDIKRKLRDLKYFYSENKWIIHIIGGIALVVIVVGGFFLYRKVNKFYSLNTKFFFDNYSVSVSDAYITQYNYKHEIINEGKTYLLVGVKANKTSSEFPIINTPAMELSVEGHKFYPIKMSNTFIDIGQAYVEQKLSSEEKEYLLVYELPKSFEGSRMILTAYTPNDEYRTKIKAQKIDKQEKEKTYKLKDTIDFSDSIFKGVKLTINSAELKDSFEVNYTFKVSNDESLPSKEVVRPVLEGNDEKILLKLTGNIDVEENLYLSGITLPDFITRYGKITYEKDGKSYNMKLDLNYIETQKVILTKSVYIEVLKEIEKADHISLVFDIHNKKYSYVLK